MKITERLYKILPATFPRFHITIERWKFNEQYKVWVSNQGNALDENKNPIKRMTSNQKYMIFRIDGSLVQAHRLVLMTWQPRKDMDKLTVDHINSNPRDNRLCNLEWVTREENLRRANNNVLNASKKVTPRNSVQELPFGVPLLSKNLGFDNHDAVPYTDLREKIRNNEVVFKVADTFYTADELYEKFNTCAAQRENFIKKACSRAFEGKAYNGMYIELIRVK